MFNKKFKLISKISLFIIGFYPIILAATVMNYEEAWSQQRAFSGENLREVTSLFPGDDPHQRLSDEKKYYLANSLTLTNLRILDLQNQGINDDFINILCNNPTFSRLVKINLCRNAEISQQSLKYISDSPYIGSIRDLPQISARYERYSSEVYLELSGTNIGDEIVGEYNREPKNKNFTITYLHPRHNTYTAPTATHAIKWLKCSR